MKAFRFIGMALFAVLMCVNLASCSSDDEPDNEEVDFTGHTSTEVKINGKTFWYLTKSSGVNYFEWDNSFNFIFEGKTSEMWAEFYMEPLPQSNINSNKNIANYIRFTGNPNLGNGVSGRYNYTNGRISIREENGIFKIQFNNAVFQNYDLHDERTIDGVLSFRL